MLKTTQQEEIVPQPRPQGQRYPCSGCGADLVFDPQAGAMKCPYCGNVEAVPAPPGGDNTVEERDYEAYLRPSAERLARLTPAALQVPCSGCGAVVTFEPPDVAGLCPFCGAKIVAQPQAADPLVAPEGVLPFKVPQKQATAAISQWVRTRWFAPNALKHQARQGALSGVYLPFWTYDAQTHSRYTGQRGEHYYETEHYTDSQGRRQTRQVRKTRWYPASGHVSRHFNDILIAGTESLPPKRLDALEPWDLQDLVPYEPAYLSGYKAQRYQVELPRGFEMAKTVMATVIENDVRRDIGGDEQRVHSIHTRYEYITFKHLLLPVWISAYRFRNKVYQVMVNARTAEVQGDRPYSVWKITGAILAALIVLLTIYLLSNGGGGGGAASGGYEDVGRETTIVAPASPPTQGMAPARTSKPQIHRSRPAPPGDSGKTPPASKRAKASTNGATVTKHPPASAKAPAKKKPPATKPTASRAGSGR